MVPRPSRIVAISVLSLAWKLRDMPRKDPIKASASGAMTPRPTLGTLCCGSDSQSVWPAYTALASVSARLGGMKMAADQSASDRCRAAVWRCSADALAGQGAQLPIATHPDALVRADSLTSASMAITPADLERSNAFRRISNTGWVACTP